MKSLIQWCRRYVSITLLIIIAYLVFVLFLNENSVQRSLELKQTIDSLRTEIAVHTDSMNYYYQMNQRLENDKETMERIVRENYNMKRANEDVYVFDEE